MFVLALVSIAVFFIFCSVSFHYFIATGTPLFGKHFIGRYGFYPFYFHRLNLHMNLVEILFEVCMKKQNPGDLNRNELPKNQDPFFHNFDPDKASFAHGLAMIVFALVFHWANFWMEPGLAGIFSIGCAYIAYKLGKYLDSVSTKKKFG